MEKLIKQNLVYKGRIVDLYNDDVLCSNGHQAKREVIRHPGGAGILIVNANKEILLITQYRYSYAEDLLEIPAGKLEKGEDPYQAALREMEEETGLKPAKLEDLGVIYPTCGYSSEIIYLYLATDFQKSHTHFDDDEDITSKWYSLTDVLNMIANGQIKDAKTIVAVYKYALGNINNEKNRLLLLILLIVGLVVFLLALGIGTINLSLGQVLKGLFINDQSSERLIIWQTRFPRILLGGLVGVSLAIAGSLLQTLMHNKLASPSTIGITSGASFFGYLILVVFPTLSYLLPLATIVGSLLTTILIYFLGYKKGQGPIRIILAGLAVSTLFGAFNDGIKTFFADALGNASSFLVGGLNGITWSSFWLFIPYFMVASLVILFLPLRLDVLSLGDDRAKALGLNTNLLRFITIIIVALLVGSSVAVAGLISFVGLIVPHIARILVGSKHKYLLPCSAFLGFILVILCDLIGRVILPTAEVPVGIILALLGAPFFLFLLFRRKERY